MVMVHIKRLILGALLIVFLSSVVPSGYAFFDKHESTVPMTISIGTFPFDQISPWQPEAQYQIGDRFTYNGLLWEVRALGDFTRPPEGDKLRPFGPYQEVTEEYRAYNTYFAGDTVVFEGITYQALYGGMSGQTPGTVVGWNALTDEWQPFNVYLEGDRVSYEGNIFEANYYTQGDEPTGNNVGEWAQWRFVGSTFNDTDQSHAFDEEILNATITFDGILLIENGVINTTNAQSLGMTIAKSTQGGNTYWSFENAEGRLRIRSNGSLQYNGNFSFDSLVVELP